MNLADDSKYWNHAMLDNRLEQIVDLKARVAELEGALRAIVDGPGDGFGRISPEEMAQARAALAKGRA